MMEGATASLPLSPAAIRPPWPAVFPSRRIWDTHRYGTVPRIRRQNHNLYLHASAFILVPSFEISCVKTRYVTLNRKALITNYLQHTLKR